MLVVVALMAANWCPAPATCPAKTPSHIVADKYIYKYSNTNMKILNNKYINTHGNQLVSFSCYLSLPILTKALSNIVADKYTTNTDKYIQKY